ncbi:MAG TPA: L-lactate permease [Kineosporiaceae bacterium]
MFHQPAAPVADSLLLSALVALLPLLTMFVLLGAFKVQAWISALSSLVVALGVAVVAFRMPVELALLSGTEGVTFGLVPIMWIVVNAIWLYQLTVITGRSEDLRRAFGLVSDDPRVQAIIIAFCFGGLLEALAGFGAPVAITGVMLMALGFSGLRAASVVLLANTAPVAFGAIGAPILASAGATKIPFDQIAAVVGRQCPVLAVFVPLLLVMVVDGWRGLQQTWPIAVVTGGAFAVAQFWASNNGQGELTDVIASLTGLVVAVLFLRVWQPAGGQSAVDALRTEHQAEILEHAVSGTGAARAGGSSAGTATLPRRSTGGGDDAPEAAPTGGRMAMAFAPYLIIIVVFWLAKKYQPLVTWLTARDRKIGWPGLDGQVLNAAGKPVSFTKYTLTWLNTPGSLLLISALLVLVVYRVSPVAAVKEYGAVLTKLRFSILTVGSLLGLAYVMNVSGQTTTIGTWIAAVGSSFAFFSPVLGWIGVALTGSDTSAAALFGSLQQTVGKSAGINQTLLVAANNSGGVLGKMISPQNLTIAATAVGLAGKESEIFRRVIWWSVGMLLFMCLLVGLQSTPVLSWLLP